MSNEQTDRDIDDALDKVAEEAHERMVDPQLPEAPASCNITGYYKGYKILLTQRDSNKQVKPYLQNAMTAIDWMIEQGFKPSWADETNTRASVQTAMADTSIPKCGVHGTPMKLIPAGVSKATNRPYPAFYICESLNADNTKCTFKPAKT